MSQGKSKLAEWPLEAEGDGLPGRRGGGPSSPEIVVHRLEEELIAGSLQNALKVRQGDALGGQGQLHQVRRLLPVQVVDDLGLAHGSGLWPGGPRTACSGGPAGPLGRRRRLSARPSGSAQLRGRPRRQLPCSPAAPGSQRRLPQPPPPLPLPTLPAPLATATLPVAAALPALGCRPARSPPRAPARPRPGAAPPPAPAEPRWPRGRWPGSRPGPQDTPPTRRAASSDSCAPVPGRRERGSGRPGPQRWKD